MRREHCFGMFLLLCILPARGVNCLPVLSGGGCSACYVDDVSDPGYYLAGDNLQRQECRQVETGFYSPGGFNAQRLKCPMNTTTLTSDSSEEKATSLSYCICEAGFTPASAERLGDPSSAESQFMKWLAANPIHSKIQAWQVCIRCPRGTYKDKPGSQECTPCPEHSFSSVEGAGAKSLCDMCNPGYYHTGNTDMPCAECPKDHFCVGSEVAIPALAVYAGKKIPCPANSQTVPPETQNDHPLKCMCKPGYMFDYVDASSSAAVCTPVRVGEYKDIISNVLGTKCPAESSTRGTGSTSLEDCICTVGHYFNADTFLCEPCPIGHYCPGGRNADTGEHMGAQSCPPETNTTGMRSASVVDCLCDKGYYRVSMQMNPGETVVCRPCPANSYKGWVGNDVCKTCSENSGTEEMGAVSAAQCLCTKGYYYDVALGECIACSDPLKYCPGGQVDCEASDPDCVNGRKPSQPQPCPMNTRITPGYDTPSSLDDCKCDRGFAYRGDALVGTKSCVACAAGTYKSSVQDSNCNGLCGSSSTSVQGAQAQSQCFCEEGTYFAADACHSCPVGAICHGGLLEEAQAKLKKDPSFTAITSAYHVKPFAEVGYFLNKLREDLDSPTDWQFIQCPIPDACLLHGVCSETMTEYLCSECKYGYTNTFSKGEICTACPSMAWNISFIAGYYVATLMFNIVMTYMNVAAGFNRRSIHSIVIKIASNYLTCISVLGVVDMNTIDIPPWLTNLTTSVAEQVAVKQRSRWMSVDCVLREGFDLSFSDSFFYTMLFYTLVPIALPILVTIFMYIIVQRVHAQHRKAIQRKLDLLRQTEQYGLYTLSAQLREKFEEDRVFMIFRYIALPGESWFKRFMKFMEDMIPIYVTVLFFVYTSTTRHMLSLLDCMYIDFGRVHKAKYFLRAAMSVECDLSLNSPYLKFFLLGIAGICLWSIGIPLMCFLVLYTNRKNLNSRETRLKYGFLHNGFVKKYWYWEMVVFARKFLVIVISSVVIIPTDNMNGSRIWLSVVTAVIFLLFHLRTQPFDKRSYMTLDRLENHSMGIWTFTLIVMAMMIDSGFQGNVNVALLIFLAVLSLLFFLEVMFSLVFAYFDNVRAQQTFFTVPVICYLFRYLARLSEKRRAREPIVIYDVDNELIQLVAAKRQTWNIFRARNKSINLGERNYFIKVMAETLGFAVVHMKLDVIPGSFLEFALRLGMTFHRMEEDSQRNNKSLQAIAEGDLSHLVDWSKHEQEKKDRTGAAEEGRKAMMMRMNSFYKKLERRMRENENQQAPSATDPEEQHERLLDCEGEFADEEEGTEAAQEEEDAEASEETSEPPAAEEDEELEADKALRLQAIASIQDLTEEEQEETMCLFDPETMSSGIALSELYLALLKLQLKDSKAISNHFAAFKAQKQAVLDDYCHMLMQKARKLKVIREVLQTLLVSSGAEIARLGLSQEAYGKKKEELDYLTKEIEHLQAKVERLREHAEEFTGELEVEWIDEEAGKELEVLEQEEEHKQEEEAVRAEAARETFLPANPADEAVIYSDSDLEEGQNSAASNLRGTSFKLLGQEAETWENA